MDLKKGSKNDDLCSDFVRKRISTLGWRNRYSQEARYPVQMEIEGAKVEFSVQQIQRGEVEETYGTGATVWPAAMVLLKYLEQHPTLCRQKNVVDLGAGTGITSVAAAILGATRTICTDGEPNVVRLATDNIARATSQLSSSQSGAASPDFNLHIETRKFWWGKDQLDIRCHLVLVADCVLPKLYPIAPLVQALDDLLETEGSQALLSYEHRYYPEYDPRDKFRELCEQHNLQVEVIPEKEHDPVFSVDDIELWRVTR